MKTWIIKLASGALLFGFVFTGCAEHRHMERDRDDRHHQRDRDHHDNDHHDEDHHDDDNH